MPGFNPGFGFSGWTYFSAFVEVIVFLILVTIIWRGRRNNYVPGATIVLRKFRFDENPSAKIAVEISGRASGLLAWALTMLRLEPEFELTVTDSEFTLRAASLSGMKYIYVPLGKITATVCGYQRSIWAFAFAIFFGVLFILDLLGGVFASSNGNETGAYMGGAFAYLIFAGVAALIYFLSKRIVISAETMHPHGLRFKRSVIENVTVDLPQALKVIAAINARVLAAQRGYSHESTYGQSGPSNSAPPSPVATGRCPACFAVNPIDVRFCENCGATLPA